MYYCICLYSYLLANGDDVSVLCNNDMAEELVTEREGDNITEVVSAVSADPTEGKLEGMEKTDSVSMDVAAVVSAEECKGDPDGDKEDTVEDFPTNSESETGVAGVPGAQVCECHVTVQLLFLLGQDSYSSGFPV